MRFDLGVDQYKRVKPTSREELAAQEAAQRETNDRVYEAVRVLVGIFKRRKILPLDPEKDRGLDQEKNPASA